MRVLAEADFDAPLPLAPAEPAVADAGPVLVADDVHAAIVCLTALVDLAPEWSPEERRGVLERMTRTIDGLAAARAKLLVAVGECGDWKGSGDRSVDAWWGRRSRLGQRAAGVQVRQAAQLDVVPAVAAAVAEGRIPLEHAAIIAKVAATGSVVQRAAASSAEGQELLLGLADELDAGALATAAARWAAGLDPAALEGDHQAQRAARFLHLVDTPRGTVIKGQVDSMAGHRLALALEAVAPKPAVGDDRDSGQRRADALDTISTRIVGFASSRPGAHVPPQVSVILTEDTWAAVKGERERRRRALETFGFRDADGDADCEAAAADAVRGYEPATLEDGTPVPAGELAVVLCDCELTRIVIDTNGVPVDLGRTERLVTGPQRRAVIARDRECGWPECHAHARWCQIHHLEWWERDGGVTSVENGVLLCNFHHHEVHRQNLAITRVPAPIDPSPTQRHTTVARVSYEFTTPAGRTFGRAQPESPPGKVVELDLTRTTDPFTGASVPAFWVA